MRPVTSTADSFAAGEILMLFIGDELWKLDDLVPGGSTFNTKKADVMFFDEDRNKIYDDV